MADGHVQLDRHQPRRPAVAGQGPVTARWTTHRRTRDNQDGDPIPDFAQSEVQRGEYERFTYINQATNAYTNMVANPAQRMNSGLFLGFYHNQVSTRSRVTNFHVEVEFYKNTNWNWVNDTAAGGGFVHGQRQGSEQDALRSVRRSRGRVGSRPEVDRADLGQRRSNGEAGRQRSAHRVVVLRWRPGRSGAGGTSSTTTARSSTRRTGAGVRSPVTGGSSTSTCRRSAGRYSVPGAVRTSPDRRRTTTSTHWCSGRRPTPTS